MSLQGINQRDSEDIFDSWIESRWLWTSGMIYGSSVKNVRTLGSFSYEDPELPSRSLGGNSWYLIGVLMTLVVRNDIYKYQGSSVQNFRPIGALEEDILHSHLSLQSILQGVLEDILDSRMEYRWLWTPRMTCTNIKEALCKISDPLVHWKRIFSFVSPERPPRNLGGHSWFLNGVKMTLDVRNDIYKC